MKHSYAITYKNVTLRPLVHADIEQLRIWRNDSANSRFISKLPVISPEAQETWFVDYLSDQSTVMFAICVNSELIGSVALYDICGTSAEFGRLMIGSSKGCGIGGKATVAALKLAYESLGLDEVRAEVSVDNTPAIVIYTRVGFCIIGREYSVAARMDEFKLLLRSERFVSLENNEINNQQ